MENEQRMHSVRTKITLLAAVVVVVTLGIATAIGVASIRNLGRSDADQMLHLTATTGAMGLETYFESVEHSVETVATLVQDSFVGMQYEDLESQVERARNLFGRIAYNTNGVLTYYFRIDPELSKTVKGFWYVYQNGGNFEEHEVTDITQYDTSDTSSLVWFTVPKATGEGVWLPPYYTENLDARVISYNVPVYWENQFVGVIGIEIDYEVLAQEVEHIKIFDTGYAFILDENSNVVYHPQLDSAQLDLETTAIDAPNESIGSNHVKYNYEGVEKEAVWVPLSNGMRLYVTAPESEINRGWESMIWNMLVASLIILAVSSMVLLGFTGRLTKPLRELTEAAKRVNDGDYEFTLEYDENDEIGVLTRTFKQLAANTETRISNAEKMASVDPLTGVKNKNAYEQWEKEIDARIEKGEQEPFAAVVCDINGLKTVNDLHGHKEGDNCIKEACAKVCGIFTHSPVFRIGGDEFAVILTGEDFDRRQELVEQANAISGDYSKIGAGETLAAGMADYDKDRHHSLSNVFADADRAMYERKQLLKESVTVEDSKPGSVPAPEYISAIETRRHILIVDDIQPNREIMGDLLGDDYEISYASDGAEALETLRNNKGEIDLVLLDLLMPNKDGRETLAEIQVDEDLRSIPTIVLTVDQEAELDCLKIGAMDFIPKPYPDVEIVKARIDKCIELAEGRELIRHTERDKLTGLLNMDYFFRYVSRLDHIYKDTALDAVVCDVNHFYPATKQYGRQFGNLVLRTIGTQMRKLARKTGGIGCRQGIDTFLLYCPRQDDYEQLIQEFTSEVLANEEIADKVHMRFGVFSNAHQEADIEERFVRAKIAADRVKDDPQVICGYYDLG